MFYYNFFITFVFYYYSFYRTDGKYIIEGPSSIVGLIFIFVQFGAGS